MATLERGIGFFCIALLLSYSSSAAQSTWLEKGALRLPVHGACIDEQ